ncbi:MAG: hypothetical protein M1834_005770 [Cirrosporium novae-zelandiae]|nr:MAG: hypothetical protein M1834_005770 [Cirrosporium novae-zelandiae]
MVQWTQAEERNLFLAIIQIAGLKSVSWPEVSAIMGPGFSSEACRQHFGKIRRDGQKGSTSSTPTTPSKQAKSAPAKTPTPRRKRKAAESVDCAAEDDSEPDIKTPVKVKTEPPVSAEPTPKRARKPARLSTIKVEDADENGRIYLDEDEE